LGGPLEGPVLPQGELSMVCVGLSERNLKKFGRGTGGGQAKIGGVVAPLGTPLSPPLALIGSVAALTVLSVHSRLQFHIKIAHN